MAELPDLGKQCSVETCKQLDFLPFQCDGCGNVFCSDHRTKDNHGCSLCLQEKTTLEYNGPKAFTCDLNGCGNRELTPLPCEHCQRSFCLRHRHQQDHQCSKLLDAPVRGAKTAEHVKQILAAKEVRAPDKPRRIVNSKSSSTARKVALMKLKMHATGDKGIPDSERVYLNVQLPQTSSLTTAAMFFSKKWSIGRIIDYMTSTHGIPNANNTVTDKKLRLFVNELDEELPVDESLESQISSVLDSGATVILKYVTGLHTHSNETS
ncbi:AN1-type zinc finger protein 1-like [Gigantopelta aegis]|uniref:AN1-type zinc finger protein 1-like n=1 Tax=Gigantopelta aegis TaxID=1735272 RepID=UPI001B8873AC|nr:AN1-type zinc finger protein 1-like [Gigantopelta aegis]